MATKKTTTCEPKPYKTWTDVLAAKAAGTLPRGTRIVEDSTGFGVYAGATRLFATTFVDFAAAALKASKLRIVRDG